MVGHAVVGPAREVELPDLPDLVSAPLRNRVTVLNTQSAAACREEVKRGAGVGGGGARPVEENHRHRTECKHVLHCHCSGEDTLR